MRFRLNPLVVGGLMLALVVVGVFLFLQPNPQDAGVRFMDALARGDSSSLASHSFAEGESQEQLKEKWAKVVEGPGQYYRFFWKVQFTTQSGPENAAVSMMLVRDATKASSYEEKFELPMVKKNGRWLVDIYSLDRRIYPYLPRPGQ